MVSVVEGGEVVNAVVLEQETLACLSHPSCIQSSMTMIYDRKFLCLSLPFWKVSKLHLSKERVRNMSRKAFLIVPQV